MTDSATVAAITARQTQKILSLTVAFKRGFFLLTMAETTQFKRG